MSLLWSGKTERKLLTTQLQKPSPTCQSSLMDSARNPEQNLSDSKSCLSVMAGFIEGISLAVSRFGIFHVKKRVVRAGASWRFIFWLRTGGGMTVEAAIVLPLVLFFFLNLGCAIEMIRLRGNLQLALWQTGRELSVYGYALDSGEMPGEESQEEDWWKDLAGKAFSSVFIKNRLVKLVGEDYLDSSPLTKGADSLQLWESEVFGTGDIVDIVITYSVSPWSALAGFSSFRMANRYYAHLWNGYQLVGEEENTEANKTVYVTSNSEVYHLYRDCTHLWLTVRAISRGDAALARNQDGERYRPCRRCRDNSVSNILYITGEGNCFHCDRECPGLKRTVYSILLKEAADLRLCIRCGQR